MNVNDFTREVSAMVAENDDRIPTQRTGQHDQLTDIARDVVTDYGDRCDRPADCTCSMARLVRFFDFGAVKA